MRCIWSIGLVVGMMRGLSAWAAQDFPEHAPKTSDVGITQQSLSDKTDTPSFSVFISSPGYLCAPAQIAPLTVRVHFYSGFSNPVTLSVSGLPEGYTSAFSVNPVESEGDSILTLTGPDLAAGKYTIMVTGEAADAPLRTTDVTIRVVDYVAPPMEPELPADGEYYAGYPEIVFSWPYVTNAQRYHIQISEHSDFSTLFHDSVEPSSSVEIPGFSPDTTYYWHIAYGNVCGEGAFSPTFSFSTHLPYGQGSSSCEEAPPIYNSDIVSGNNEITHGPSWYIYQPLENNVVSFTITTESNLSVSIQEGCGDDAAPLDVSCCCDDSYIEGDEEICDMTATASAYVQAGHTYYVAVGDSCRGWNDRNYTLSVDNLYCTQSVPGGVLYISSDVQGTQDYAREALNNLGISNVTQAFSPEELACWLANSVWDLVIIETFNMVFPELTWTLLETYCDAGGKLIFFHHRPYSDADQGILDRAGVDISQFFNTDTHVYPWDNPQIFTTPNGVPSLTLCSLDTFIYSNSLTVISATPMAGYTQEITENEAAITINADNKIIVNGFCSRQACKDGDKDGKTDVVELYENEIAALGVAPPTFVMAGNPLYQEHCVTDTLKDISIQVSPTLEYVEPVMLSIEGLPTGSTALFSVNPVVPPGTSILSLDLPEDAVGTHNLVITGTGSNTTPKTLSLQLWLQATGSAVTPTLYSPDNGEEYAGYPNVQLSWGEIFDAFRYRVQVSDQNDFSTLLYNTWVTSASYTAEGLTPGSTYYWRVRSVNRCGESPFSAPKSFMTQLPPGQGHEYCEYAPSVTGDATLKGYFIYDICCGYYDISYPSPVWFKYTSSCCGPVTLSLGYGYDRDRVITVFDSCSGNILGSSETGVTVETNPSTDYLIQLSMNEACCAEAMCFVCEYILHITPDLCEGENTCPGEHHSADQDGNGQINVSELLRVIQLFNSDGYQCDASGEDGYAPDSGDTSCSPHSSDYNPQDWMISLTELLRLVQFYNSTSFYPCEGAEDGYCPGV